MSTSYILEKLREIDSLEKRREEAVRLFGWFKDRMPSGSFNPPIFGDCFDGESVRASIRESSVFYKRILELCGNEMPVEIKEVYAKFQRNSERTEQLLRMPLEKQRKLKTHEMFPFWNDFNGEAHKLFEKNYWGQIDVDALTFLPKFVTRGGFASIYMAKDDDGKDYALKLFHPLERFPIGLDLRRARKNLCSQIAENIEDGKDFFSKEPFACLRAFPYSRDEDIKCYLMDFIPGQTVYKSLERKIVLSAETIGNVLLTYAQMLESLHSEGKLFVDNNWGAVIVNGEDVRICDYDFATTIDNVSSDDFHPYQSRYGSREHYISKGLGKSSDLEQFALMADHLLSGKPLLSCTTLGSIKNRKIAGANKRDYPREKISRLSKQLRSIIPFLISYPRDDSISAVDFVAAVKEDYGL